MLAKVIERAGFSPKNPGAKFGHVQIGLNDALFGPQGLDQNRKARLHAFAQPRAFWPEKHILGGLLADGGATAQLATALVALHRFLDRDPVKAIMATEFGILRRNH